MALPTSAIASSFHFPNTAWTVNLSMFDDFRKRRAAGDILDVPGWVHVTYLISSACISIFATFLASDILPQRFEIEKLLLGFILLFFGLGIFLLGWVTRSPIRRLIPTICFIFVLAISLQFAPSKWMLIFGLIAFIWIRIRVWMVSRNRLSKPAP